MSAAYRFNLLPIIRDLEIMLLRKLVLLEKKNHQHKKTPIAKIIAAGRRSWHNWPRLATQNRSEIKLLRQELRDYLGKQLIAQACELIDLSEGQLSKLAEIQQLSTEERQALIHFAERFGLKCRYYPAYLPDMQTMMEYTLRAAETPSGREILEAINTQFFHRLMLRPDLMTQLRLMEDFALVEISLPKPRESQEIFLRVWETILVPNLGPRWQVTNFSLPYNHKVGKHKIAAKYPVIDAAASLGLENLPLKNNIYMSLSKLVLIETNQINELFQSINPEFKWTTDLLVAPADFIRGLIRSDLNVVDDYLEEIVLRLTKPAQRDYLQTWEQLLITLIARHSRRGAFSDKLPADFTPEEYEALRTKEALASINHRHFDRFIKKAKLPQWLYMKDIPAPTPAQVTIDDLHNNFQTPVVALPITAAGIIKLQYS